MAVLADVMTTAVQSTAPTASVQEVAAEMVRGRHGSCLVMTGPMLLGIFTERDVLRAAASGQDLRTSTVGQWMTKDPVTAPADTATEAAVETMLANGFRHLPVVEGERVMGVVSLRDVLSARIVSR
jgi:CBS domain-containing protein